MGTTSTAPAATTLNLAEVRAMLERCASQGDAKQACDVALQVIEQLFGNVNQLSRQLAKALQRASGNRSEKIDPTQLWLDVVKALEMVNKPAPPPPPAPAKPAKPRSRPTGRKPLPPHLPREVDAIKVPSEQRTCEHGERVLLPSEMSETLELMPPVFKVIVHDREKLGCPKGICAPVTASVADKVIAKGLPGPGLLAQVLVQKYCDHMPLNRQLGMFGRSGVELSVSTLCDWVREGAALLGPISDAIFEQAMAAHVMQGDDTGLRVLDKSAPGGSKKGHLWAFIGDRLWLGFKYTATWQGKEARKHVGDRKGLFQVDGYAGFDVMFNADVPVVFEIACWSHARRKAVEARDSGDVRAAIVISIIAKLFGIEKEAGEAGMGYEQRRQLRQEKSKPVLDEIEAWLKEMAPHAPPKSPLGHAITYMRNQWKALCRFLEDGAIELTNNAVERALRAVAIGRLNWQFAGSDEGARRAAVIYTIIGTCKLQGVDPWAYIRDVLSRLAKGVPDGGFRELLPDKWAQAPAVEQAATAALPLPANDTT
jgi:transposase